MTETIQVEPETLSMPVETFNGLLQAIRIGIENTEEVFIQNGSRNTRSERLNAARLEQEIAFMKRLESELLQYQW